MDRLYMADRPCRRLLGPTPHRPPRFPGPPQGYNGSRGRHTNAMPNRSAALGVQLLSVTLTSKFHPHSNSPPQGGEKFLPPFREKVRMGVNQVRVSVAPCAWHSSEKPKIDNATRSLEEALAMEVFEYMGANGHEQLVICADPAVGLKAIIAVHDTTLGPACGGTRIWPYKT